MTIEIIENPDGTKTIQVRGNTSQRFSIEGILATYENIKINFYKMREARAHVGLSEISFGNMQRFESSRQHGQTTITEQIDPLGLQSYPSRIDFTLNGIRDTDVSSFARVAVSARCRDPTTGEPALFTIGTYYITAVSPVDKDKTRITAEDIRTILSKNTVSLTIEQTDKIKNKLEEMLNSLNAGYYIDDVLDVSPPTSIVYENVDPMKVLTDASSMYGVDILTDGNGRVILTKSGGVGRNISSSNLMSWAASESAQLKHNQYDLGNDIIVDFRMDKTIPLVKVSVDNEMLKAGGDVQNLIMRIANNYALNSVTMETTGDTRIELGDKLNVQTREGWTEVTVTGIENRVGSAYRQKITGLMKPPVREG